MVEKRQVICVVLGITAAVASFFVDNADGVLQDGYRVERNSYGEGARVQELWVSGLVPEEIPLSLEIGERRYGAEAAETAFESAAARLGAELRGENTSLEEVRTALSMPGWLEDYGISVEWRTENPELVESDGTVHSDVCPEEGERVGVSARMRAGAYEKELRWEIQVLPPVLSGEEIRKAGFMKLLRQMDEAQQEGGQFILPEEYEGGQLRYRVEKSRDFLLFPVLGLAAAVLLPLRDRQKEKEKRKERDRQMMADYPQIVSKLAVFSGAGLPIRRAWERIVKDYEGEKGQERAAYGEMAAAYHMMQRGVPELQAYAEFGNRCRLRPYRKLAGLLEQNIRNGPDGLRAALETEMESAFEEQKATARRLGEEASTKLLLPLFMTLMIVMVMVTVPAFLSFGF